MKEFSMEWNGMEDFDGYAVMALIGCERSARTGLPRIHQKVAPYTRYCSISS